MLNKKNLFVAIIFGAIIIGGLAYLLNSNENKQINLNEQKSEKNTKNDKQLLRIVNESQKVRSKKEDRMKELKVEFTPSGIVNGIKNNLFSYENDIDPEIRERSCIAWQGNESVAFGSTGSIEVNTIRSELLSVKKDEQLVENFFRENGFVRNEKNSDNNFDILNAYREVDAYENGELKCIISWSEISPDEN